MTLLSQMEPEERGLLVGLLYRAGIWIGHAEDEHGKGDDLREGKALAHIVKAIARTHEETILVREIAQAVLSHKDKWPQWADHSFDILADCEKAAALLKNKAGEAERRDYCRTLVVVVESVAAAYGEFGMGAEDENTISAFLGKITEKLKGESGGEDDFMNISPAEEDALARLRCALHMEENADSLKMP